MRKLTKEELLDRRPDCPGWHSVLEELVDIADTYDIPLRTVAFQRKRGLRAVYPRGPRFSLSEEGLSALETAAEKCKNLCWECGCDVEGTCICDECCNP